MQEPAALIRELHDIALCFPSSANSATRERASNEQREQGETHRLHSEAVEIRTRAGEVESPQAPNQSAGPLTQLPQAVRSDCPILSLVDTVA